jgi:ParB-like chromosome segregation protein Spo0J
MDDCTHERPQPQTSSGKPTAPYQILPPLTDTEYTELRDDIAARGVLISVEVDEHDVVLDGHHRVAICRELGIDYPKIVRTGLSEAEKRNHVLKLNIARRHLDSRQKRDIIKQQLRESPQVSNNKIAADLGVSDKTVTSARRELESTSEIPKLAKTVGADGKARKARPARAPIGKTPALRWPVITVQKLAQAIVDEYGAKKAKSIADEIVKIVGDKLQ